MYTSERSVRVAQKKERTADATVRFSQHPSGSINDVFMEPIDNALSYGKSYLYIRICPGTAGDTSIYQFFNDADIDDLPTYEKMVEIADTAGKSISAGKGLSICGMGTEAFLMSGRPVESSVVNGIVTINRDGQQYGYELTVNGGNRKVESLTKEPVASSQPNTYKFETSDMQPLKKFEIDEYIYQLKEKLYFKRKLVPDFKIKLSIELEDGYYPVENNGFIVPFDSTMDDKVSDDMKFHKKLYFFNEKDEKEFVDIKINDVSKSDDTLKLPPSHSGVAIIYDGLSSVHRGEESFNVLGIKNRRTYTSIRSNVNIGQYMFKHLHSETQVKHRTPRTLWDIKDEYGQSIQFYDEYDNPVLIKDIVNEIKKFCREHANDSQIKRNNKLTIIVNEVSNNVYIMKNLRVIKEFISVVSNIDGGSKLAGQGLLEVVSKCEKQKRQYPIIAG